MAKLCIEDLRLHQIKMDVSCHYLPSHLQANSGKTPP